MAELVCQHCGSPNQVNSEYLVFCHACGKRLRGTFTEWKKDHHDGSFSEYKAHLQKQSHLVAGNTSFVRPKSGKKVLWFVAGFLIAAAGVVILTRGTAFTGSGLRLTPSEMLKSPWKRYTCGRFGLSVELPGKMDKETVANEGDTQTEQYTFHPPNGFQATLTSVKHTEKVTGLETLATETLNSIMNQPGVAGVRYEVAPIQTGDIPGILVQGTLERDGVGEIFYAALFVKSLNTWKVHIRHLAGDENGAQAADRILDSVEINYFGTHV